MKVRWEAIAAFAFGVVFVIVLLGIALLKPDPTQFQYDVFRSVLALACAGVATVIPGLLQIRVNKWIRAGGALAVFVLVYQFSPAKLVTQPDLKPENRSIKVNNRDQLIKLQLNGPHEVNWTTQASPSFEITPNSGHLDPWARADVRVRFSSTPPVWQRQIVIAYGKTREGQNRQIVIPIEVERSADVQGITISGFVISCEIPHKPLPKTRVNLRGAEVEKSVLSDTTGRYVLSGLERGKDYEVVWEQTGYTFPLRIFRKLNTSQEYTVCGTNGESYAISGHVRECGRGAGPIPGVLIRAQGKNSIADALTDASGHYRIGGLPAGGNYEIALEKMGYSFKAGRSFRKLADDENFEPCGSSTEDLDLDLEVAVHDRWSSPIKGVNISLMIEGGGAGNWPRNVTTGRNGRASFGGLIPGRSYNVAATSSQYTVTPPTQSLVLASSSRTINFQAMLSVLGVVRWIGRETEIQAKMAGRIQSTVSVGSRVGPGDPLVQLNCLEHESALSYWRTAEDAARQKLDVYTNQKGKEKLPEFQQVIFAQNEVNRITRAWNDGVASTELKEQAEQNLSSAKLILDQADTHRIEELEQSVERAVMEGNAAGQLVQGCSYTSDRQGVVVWSASEGRQIAQSGTLLRIVEADKPKVAITLGDAFEESMQNGRSVEILIGRERYRGRVASLSEDNGESGPLQAIIDFADPRLTEADLRSLVGKRTRVIF